MSVLSSKSLPVSALSDAIIFSPDWKVPETFTRLITASVLDGSFSTVSVLNTNPTALEVLPFTLTPVEWVAVRVGLGVALSSILVNI